MLSFKSRNVVHDSNNRDLALDFFRGLCLFAMIVWHSASPVYFFETYWLWPQSVFLWVKEIFIFAAEGFVFVSGITLGLILRKKLAQVSWWKTVNVFFTRAGKILLLHYLLVFAIVWFLQISGWQIIDWSEITKNILLLQHQNHLINILPMFVAFSLVSPLVLWLLRDYLGQLLLVIGSLVLVVVSQIEPYIFSFQEFGAFPLVSWQWFFVFGSLIGCYLDNFRRISDRVVLFLLVIFISLFFLEHAWQIAHVGQMTDLTNLFMSFSKFPLGGLRIVFVSVILVLLTVIIFNFPQNFFVFITSRQITIYGKMSLTIFTLHVFIVYLGQDFFVRQNIHFPFTISLLVLQLLLFLFLGKLQDKNDKIKSQCLPE